MHFIIGITPVAEASVDTLMTSINRVIINPIIYFLFALALAYFLYGIAEYLLNPGNEEIRKKSKTQMFTGVLGLFIMVAVFGIMNLILNTVGEKRIKLQDTGNYAVTNNQNKYTFNTAGDNTNPTEVDITSGDIDLRGGGNIDLTNVKSAPVDFNKSPFRVKYLPSDLCWREEVHVSAPIEYQAVDAVKKKAKDDLANVVSGDKTPINYGILTAYDGTNKVYHAWMDARYPIKGGTKNDCVLQVDTENTPPLPLDNYVQTHPFSVPTDMSTGPSILTTTYSSDSLFTRVVASGVNPLLELAREIAIKNAFLLLGIKIKDVNTLTTVYPDAKILEEKYIVNPNTGNYEYWVAVEASKPSDTAASTPTGN